MSLPHFLVDDHTAMINFIEKILCCFESCFSRKVAFRWFGRRKGPPKSTGSCACHWDAYGPFLHCDGNPAEPFHMLYRKGQFQSAPLPEDTLQGKGFWGSTDALFPETFFPLIRAKARIIHNADNSGIAGRVRRTVGFSGFLVIQTFNSQVYYFLESYYNFQSNI